LSYRFLTHFVNRYPLNSTFRPRQLVDSPPRDSIRKDQNQLQLHIKARRGEETRTTQVMIQTIDLCASEAETVSGRIGGTYLD
jgi:hypothetical protein